ncbi:MAG TPA: hypothetical protein VFT66_18145 [Roseiflexaceae bacterium]|nr:hypothetical protein [Roseiflexaceae bacterium]
MKQIAHLMVMAVLLTLVATSAAMPHASWAAPAVPTRPFHTTGATAQQQSNSPIYLPLILGVGSSSSSPSPTPAPTSPIPTPTPPSNSGPGPFFLPNNANGVHNTTDPDVLIDAAGGMYVAYHDYAPVGDHQTAFYAYCAAGGTGGCTRAADFTMITLDAVLQGNSVVDANLALDPSGHPRMLITLLNDFLYAACDANCANAANWTITQAIHYNGLSDYHSRRFAIDQQGQPSFVYKDDNSRDHYGTWYAFCAATCSDAAQWHETLIAKDALTRPSLALTADGHPRIAVSLPGPSDSQLLYMECNTTCSDGSQWSGVVFSTINPFYSAYSLQVGTDNLPRLAVSPYEVENSFFQSHRLYYLACTTACGDGTDNDWHGGDTGLTDEAGDAVSLALDSQNRPRIAYEATQNGSSGVMEYVTCDTACDTSSAIWKPQVFDSVAALNASDPVTTTVICSNPTMPTWSLGYWASIALDASGRPRIAYDAHHLWYCSYSNGAHVETDIAWARFAQVNQP